MRSRGCLRKERSGRREYTKSISTKALLVNAAKHSYPVKHKTTEELTIEFSYSWPWNPIRIEVVLWPHLDEGHAFLVLSPGKEKWSATSKPAFPVTLAQVVLGIRKSRLGPGSSREMYRKSRPGEGNVTFQCVCGMLGETG